MEESGSVYRVMLDIGDDRLQQDLAAAIASHSELRLSSANPAVLITDRHQPDRWGETDAAVLLIGSRVEPAHAVAVLPSRDPQLIVSAAHLLAAGYRLEFLRDDESDSALAEEEPSRVPPHLTPREREVAGLLVDGASNKIIARRLGISVHTAKFHVAAVLEKLGARNRADAVAIAMREGLVSL